MNNILVIAPNKQAAEHAKRMDLVDHSARYIGISEGIRGYDNCTIYVVDYGYRPEHIGAWGSFTNCIRRDEFMKAINPMRNVEIRYVVLP